MFITAQDVTKCIKTTGDQASILPSTSSVLLNLDASQHIACSLNTNLLQLSMWNPRKCAYSSSPLGLVSSGPTEGNVKPVFFMTHSWLLLFFSIGHAKHMLLHEGRQTAMPWFFGTRIYYPPLTLRTFQINCWTNLHYFLDCC